ncbi:MAG: ABC transporter ATP-binding protein [Candidatus Ornithospirochaeta sp.]|nr:ABC transporter ATP-binding protein [Candidatus Ornithospirochaeta sp.]
MHMIFRYILRHKWVFMLSLMFLALEAFADLLQPAFMAMIVDRGLKEGSVSGILVYGMKMLAIAFCGAICAVMRCIFSSKVSQLVGKEVRKDLYEHVMELSLEDLDYFDPSQIITMVTSDSTQIQEFVNSLMRMMIKAPITASGCLIMIAFLSPAFIPLLAILIAAVFFLVYAKVSIGYPKFSLVQTKLEKLNGRARDFLSSVRVVKAFTGEEKELEGFSASSDELADANCSALKTIAVFTPLINLAVNLAIVIALFASRRQDAAQIGVLMAIVNYMTQLLFSLTMLSRATDHALRAKTSADRIARVLGRKPSLENGSMDASRMESGIEFDNVTFSYSGASKPSIDSASFSIRPGEKVGIIGQTGSGKSTLISLIARFYDPDSGTVSIDGTDIRKYSSESLMRRVAIVSQKAVLFSGTIKDNLAWGNRDASDEEIRRAAEIAQIRSFIESLPDGYGTMLGQGGVNLSGGQKQRMSIARSILRKPSVLILDDATSALDASTEKKVLEGIIEESKDITLVIVSQRISTVRNMERVIVLDKGRIAAEGRHDELLDSCDLYNQIYLSQVGGDR